MGEYIGLFVLIIYLAAISVFAVALTIKDKKTATKNGSDGKGRRRVPEKTLFITAAMGGSIAMYITMLKIRHKTKHKRFMIGIPCIIAAQLALVVLLIVLL